MTQQHKQPSLLDALAPVIFLIGLLGSAVFYFGDSSSSGANQIALLLSAGLAAIIGIKNGFCWNDIEQGIIKGISLSLTAVLILLAVGSLIGTWLLSGTVPTMIYFGLQILSPSFFYAASCLICAIVAISIGSSWTVAATIGVALMGVATGLGVSLPITAGAIISGAYFGDKMSPLSDTTNLAPAVAGTDLFTHIKHMAWTSFPSFIFALIVFAVLGFSEGSNVEADRISQLSQGLSDKFHLGWYLLIPLVVTLTLAVKKVAAFPAVFIGALVGGLWAVLFQQELIVSLAATDLNTFGANVTVVWTALFDGISVDTGDADLNDLLSGGGMSSMLTTIWLIVTAMTFGAVMEKVGLLSKVVELLVGFARSTSSLIITTIVTAFGSNVLTADQYISIVMPGRMFKDEYEKRKLAPENLSRALEDGGTVTSVLVPWNTCGAYMQSVLLVSPLEYALFCVFNWASPIFGIIFAIIGFKIKKLATRAV
ncbi:Na+/H+ antiporter NhaC [Psychrobium sp. 1_MG-2023]|uniref:Na+/H+ antiporter NhaC n=1 Tax=Psychrobium sp. 1_MG-2023 TaxID=3062624 RepID=UPI000C3479A0|nr:Na+/H+ antiporter NhaC [Psychrobium sp. 1_MG-2023]MDP2560375.1 Na+/H+ antiporter NhaC [Psychrobium sp. 1_MG-2023]PKF55485.1 Na+/H+ antiporter NhaC [Alteromonadales bacterium alter-6D02]